MTYFRILKIKILLLFILFFLCLPPSVHASALEFEHIELDALIVQFPKPLRGTAQEVVQIYPAIKTELERNLGWTLDFRPTVRLIKNNATFQRMTGHKLVVAFALPQKNIIVIDTSKMTTHPFSLAITLKHELAHLLLHHQIESKKLPKWFDEGIAQWVSGGIAEILMRRDDRILRKASLSGKLIPLDELTRTFPQEETRLLLAYEESKNFIEYIEQEFGVNGLRQVLTHLKDGENIETAIFKGLSIPLDTLEKRWHGTLENNLIWFTYIGSNLYLFLFTLVALATIYGFIRFLLKKRNYVDDEEVPFNWPNE